MPLQAVMEPDVDQNFRFLEQSVSDARNATAPDADKLDGIDSTGFLQLAVAATRKIAFGTIEVEFAGGTKISKESAETAHGLGVEPVAVICTPLNDYTCMYAVTARTSSKFKVRASFWDHEPGAGTKATAMWVAIG